MGIGGIIIGGAPIGGGGGVPDVEYFLSGASSIALSSPAANNEVAMDLEGLTMTTGALISPSAVLSMVRTGITQGRVVPRKTYGKVLV